LEEFDPVGEWHIAELPANQADLMKRAFAVAMRWRLFEAHRRIPGEIEF
jgi:hypothetical protein